MITGCSTRDAAAVRARGAGRAGGGRRPQQHQRQRPQAPLQEEEAQEEAEEAAGLGKPRLSQGCNIEAADTQRCGRPLLQNSNVSDLSAHRITEEEHTRRHDLLVSKHAKEAKEEVEERSRRLSANPRESLEALQALRPEQDPCAAALRVK